jgi:RNA polymerase primary sigma factor
MAVLAGSQAAVEVHIRRGVVLDATDKAGRSPLMLAAARGRVEICRMLLDAGANPRLLDPAGNDACSIALKSDRPDIVALLHERLQVAPEPLEPRAHLPETDPPVTAAAVGTEGDALGLSFWEPEFESPAPPSNPEPVHLALVLQHRIEKHAPIDTDEDWTDVEVQLPHTIRAARPNAAFGDRARDLVRAALIDGLHDGYVALARIADATSEEDERVCSDLQSQVLLALGDLGIVAADGPWEEATESRVTPSDSQPEEEAEAAIEFVAALSQQTDDPFRLYMREVGQHKLLSPDEERDFGRTMEEAFGDALRALARSPSAVNEVLRIGAEILAGNLPLRTLTDRDLPPVLSNGNVLGSENEQEIPRIDGSVPPAAPHGAPTKDLASQLEALRVLQSQVPAIDELRLEGVVDLLAGLALSWRFIDELSKLSGPASPPPETCQALPIAVAKMRQARDQLTVANLRLAIWVARKYTRSGEALMDLIQDGTLGLMRAAERFDHRLGFRFSTYAQWWIRQSITRGVADKGRTIRIPVYLLERLNKIDRLCEKVEGETGCTPEAAEVAKRLDMSIDEVKKALAVPRAPVALDGPLRGDAVPPSVADSIADTAPTPEQAILDANIHRAIVMALQKLTPQQAKVIRLRFGLDDGIERTLEDAAHALAESRAPLSRERIRQIESKAFERLQRISELRFLLGRSTNHELTGQDHDQ